MFELLFTAAAVHLIIEGFVESYNAMRDKRVKPAIVIVTDPRSEDQTP